MSKIGSYIIAQIEKGNFAVDERGTYHVELAGDRKERTPTLQPTAHSIRGDESRGQRTDQAQKKE